MNALANYRSNIRQNPQIQKSVAKDILPQEIAIARCGRELAELVWNSRMEASKGPAFERSRRRSRQA